MRCLLLSIWLLLAMPVSFAAGVSIKIDQTGNQSGTLSMLTPNQTSYVLGSDFKFFATNYALGSTQGFLDIVSSGCSADDFSDFVAGSIALLSYSTGCLFSDRVDFAEQAGATGFILTADSGALGSYGLVDTVNIQAVVVSDSLGSYLHVLAQGGVPQVPVPAAVWLFGSALAGLGWLIRRKTV
jgi:hypothetical protein